VVIERWGAVGAVALFSAWVLTLAILTSANRHVRHAAPIARSAAA
jgi:hypothetical protein